MKKDIRCFIVNSDYATSDSRTISPVYELSEEGLTYAKRKQFRSITGDDKNTIFSFHFDGQNELTNDNYRSIVEVVEQFVISVSSSTIVKKEKLIADFLNEYNPTAKIKITDFNFNDLISHDGYRYPDMVSFSTVDMNATVWISDASFRLMYPLYDIDLVTPFKEFDSIVKNSKEMLKRLDEFDYIEFNKRIDATKEGYPSTYSRVDNIRYREHWTAKLVPCYFAFNIYGIAGDEEYIMRETLYDHLSKDLGLSDDFIEEHFPDLFKVNEFFIVPTWDDYAIPFRTGQGSINSQINLAYAEPMTLNRFVKAYTEEGYLFNNTYNVPSSYNNLMLRVVNGRYSAKELKDFKELYSDMITVPSTSPDFDRMSQKTQHFMMMLSDMLRVADAKSQTELFSNIMNSKANIFKLSYRTDITYISILHDKHRYYLIPMFEYERVKDLKP